MSAFPASPTNGQQVTVNGVVYTYSTALTAWTVTSSGGSLTSASSLNVTGNVTAGNLLVTEGDATTFTATGNVIGGNLVTAGQLVSSIATGTAPLAITSTTKVTNLNVEQVDGYHADTAATASTIAVRDASGVVTANGFITAAGTTSVAPIDMTAGTNLTSPTAGAIEYDGTIATLTPNTSFGRAPISTPIFTSGVGTSGITLNTNYALFPAAGDTITLPVGTYYVQTAFQITVATATVSATTALNIRGAGTAVGSMTWHGTSSITQGGAASQFQVAATALGTNIVVTAASAVAGRVYLVRGTGILKVTTAGTIIPAYQFSATLTSGVVTLFADNHMVITPLASSGTATQTGAWA